MSGSALVLGILCACGQPEGAPIHQGSGHRYSPMRGHHQVRDNQVVDDGWRDGHSTISEQRVVTLAKPAAGVDWQAKIPNPASWRVNCLQCQLTTSAAIANRIPHLVITDGQGNSVWNFPAGTNQVAATVAQYSAGQESVSAANDNAIVLVLPEPVTLLNGWTIGMVTTALDAADQWANIALYVKEWLNF